MKKSTAIGTGFVLLSILSSAAHAYVYAGTSNPGVVYKYQGGATWTPISGSLGFGVLDIIDYKGHLYASAMSTSDTHSGAGTVWRYQGGTSWTPVAGMDDQVADLEVHNGQLYAGTAWNGGKLYQYDTSYVIPAPGAMGMGLVGWLRRRRVLEAGSIDGFPTRPITNCREDGCLLFSSVKAARPAKGSTEA